MGQTVYNVLFLCRHNSARSIIAETILNNLAVGKGRFKAYSAGSQPVEQINAFALDQIRAAGLPCSGLQSKAWNEFSAPDAPRMQFVFMVGDDIAAEQCPGWPGNPITVHWAVADPAAIEGTDTDKRRAFSRAFIHLYNRINIFASLPLANLDRVGLQRRLDDIGPDNS